MLAIQCGTGVRGQCLLPNCKGTSPVWQRQIMRQPLFVGETRVCFWGTQKLSAARGTTDWAKWENTLEKPHGYHRLYYRHQALTTVIFFWSQRSTVVTVLKLGNGVSLSVTKYRLVPLSFSHRSRALSMLHNKCATWLRTHFAPRFDHLSQIDTGQGNGAREKHREGGNDHKSQICIPICPTIHITVVGTCRRVGQNQPLNHCSTAILASFTSAPSAPKQASPLLTTQSCVWSTLGVPFFSLHSLFPIDVTEKMKTRNKERTTAYTKDVPSPKLSYRHQVCVAVSLKLMTK